MNEVVIDTYPPSSPDAAKLKAAAENFMDVISETCPLSLLRTSALVETQSALTLAIRSLEDE